MDSDIDLQPFRLRPSLVLNKFGRLDTTAWVDDHRFEKGFAGPEGPLRCALEKQGSSWRLTVEGPHADAVLCQWMQRLPPQDAYDTTRAHGDSKVTWLHHRHPGVRVVAVPWLFDIACNSVLQQRVRFADATRGWRNIVSRFGQMTDTGKPIFPGAAALARLSPDELVSCDIDFKRARALVALAREEVRRPFLNLSTRPAEIRHRMTAIPGIGLWTANMLLLYGAGDADAVPVGDLHLPHVVSWLFEGEPRGSDQRMLALLEPFAGYRGRVARLAISEQSAAPARPRTSPRVRW